VLLAALFHGLRQGDDFGLLFPANRFQGFDIVLRFLQSLFRGLQRFARRGEFGSCRLVALALEFLFALLFLSCL